MGVLIFLVLYVLSVFLNRWLNKIAYQKTDCGIVPGLWFIPILTGIVLLYIIVFENDKNNDNWFTGKGW